MSTAVTRNRNLPSDDEILSGSVKLPLKMIFAEYEAFDMAAEGRYEFYDGEVTEVSGASRQHNIIQGNLFFALFSHLKGKICRPYL
ncbi:MAG: Uma2 family endonuclease [Rhizobacter sp.]|nr:Uma2 family endonuclease [Chlorobiales bacterium]